MAKTDLICETCRTKVEAVFNPTTGTRVIELINGQRNFEDCCFVADEIHFTGNSQLVFAPTGRDRPRYCQEYFVVCRKLVISGGREAKDPTPCSPDDPGQMYSGNNVITWLDRLSAAASGADKPQAATGNPDFHANTDYQNQGQGDDGKDAGDGADGEPGNDGQDGQPPAPNFTLLAFEVEVGAGDHLTIDFDGKNGGDGGKGQKGGDGGDGMRGNKGESDTSWPGEGCDRSPGEGGDGGDGGDGGRGGRGGRGGNAGTIVVVSTPPNIGGSGVFLGPHLHYVNDGGDGGKGGKGGMGGKKGQGAKAGNPTQLCNASLDGSDGQPGDPQPGDPTADGAPGGHGNSGSLGFEPVKTGTCADQIPFPPLSVTSVTPASGAQGAAVAVTIAGVGFAPSATVDVSGIGVTVAAVPPLTVVNPTQITCTLTIGGAAPKTARDVTVKNSLVNTATLTGGFTVT